MKLVTFSGPPSSGKTAVILQSIVVLRSEGYRVGAVKFDCFSSPDVLQYEKNQVPVIVGYSGNLCPDHFFISNIEDCVLWGKKKGFDFLFCESAGLCNRCSPHIVDVLAICVIDNLSGVNTPKKIGPMLKLADIVAITKSDIVSQAEREVFLFKTQQASPRAVILNVNGINGQGAFDLCLHLKQAPDLEKLEGYRLRFSMPAALCSYCLGETKIGPLYQKGYVKKMEIDNL